MAADTDPLSRSNLAAIKDYHRRLEEDRLEDVPVRTVPPGWYENLSRPIDAPQSGRLLVAVVPGPLPGGSMIDALAIRCACGQFLVPHREGDDPRLV